MPSALGPDLAPFRDVLERLVITADLDFSGRAGPPGPTGLTADPSDGPVVAAPARSGPGQSGAPHVAGPAGTVADHPLLDLLSAVATRQVASRAGPDGRVRVTGLTLAPAGLSVHLQVRNPLGHPATGAVEARVESVGADHAYLALRAVGGPGFRAVVGTLLKAGTLLEPLLRAILRRSLVPGIQARRGHVELTYAPFLDGLASGGEDIIAP
jgi:hypothetical protein